MAEDYYKTLGVGRDASQADIQKAYRELARKYHPDLNPDDKTAKKKFQEVQTAFDVLNSAEKREMYDRYGSSFETMGAGGPQGQYAGWPPPGGGGANVEDVDFSQFFGDRFGESDAGASNVFEQFFRSTAGRSGRGGRKRGADTTYEIQVPLQTAVSGGQAQINLTRSSGKTETISVKIPAGIDDGKKIRLRGQGEPGPRGGAAGDLLLVVRVAPHPSYHRQGSNLLVRVPITVGEAAAGAKIDVPTPNGTVTLSVPPGTSSGTKLRVKGQGAAPRNGPAGDLLAEIIIVLPKGMSEEDRTAMQQISEKYLFNPRANLRW
jgi:DnaJ-class molecular chaperone